MLPHGFRADISIICVLARLTRPCSTWSGRKNYSMHATASLACVCQHERRDSATPFWRFVVLFVALPGCISVLTRRVPPAGAGLPLYPRSSGSQWRSAAYGTSGGLDTAPPHL